jgi:hypothetical protein
MYIFQQKIPILVGLGKEKVGVFYGQMEYITDIWYILWPFGNLIEIWYKPPPLHFGICIVCIL